MRVSTVVFLPLLLLLVLQAFQVRGQDQGDSVEISYFDGSLEDLSKKAAEENRYILLSIVSEWCYWCRAMEATTLKEIPVVNLLNSEYLALRVNAHSEEGMVLSARFRVKAFPTFVIFTPGGEFIEKKTGYIRNAASFAAELRKILEVQAKDLPDRGLLNAPLNPGFPDFYLQSFGQEFQKMELEFTNKAVDLLIEMEQEKWLEEVPWSLIYRFEIGMGPIGSFFLENYSVHIQKYGHNEAFSHLKTLLNQNISFYAGQKAEREAMELIETAKGLEPEQSEELELRFKVAFYMQTANWAAVLIELEDHLNRSASPDFNSVNSVVLNIHDSTSDIEILGRAADLMKKVTEKEAVYHHFDTYAALLFRVGKKEEGIAAAEKAIELGKAAGIEVGDTELLLEIYR